MSESAALFSALRERADAGVVDAIERHIREAPDHALCRINVLDFAKRYALDEERVIAAFLRAARLGIFELSWNVLCPGCGGVLGASATLKSVHSHEYNCALCAAGYEPTLDEMVEVTFTISPRIRRIAAHAPDELPFFEYMRQVFWGSGIDLPDNAAAVVAETTIDSIELPPGEKAILSLTLPAEFVIVFEPVTHSVQFLDVKGEATRERQSLTIILEKDAVPTATLEMRAPTKLTVDVAYKEKRYRLSVIPDGMLALEFRDNTEAPERSNFFLELDRETMPVMRKSKSLGKEGRQTSLLSKFLTYHAVWRQGLHKERFGWENFRVLTVTTSKKRVDTMIAAVKEITDGRGSSLFLFTDQETLGDKSILDIAWRTGKGERVRLDD